MADPFSYCPRRSRLAVIGGMMAYFESIMPPGFRGERRDHIRAVTDRLSNEFDLVDLGLWADKGCVEPMARQMQEDPCDILVLIPTMATPPAEIAALAAESGLPVVIVCAHDLEHVGESYDMVALCRHSVNVGATMLGSMLRRYRDAHPPILVSGFLSDPDFHIRLRIALRTASASKRLIGLHVGRLGHPMIGYDHVALSEEEGLASDIKVLDVPYSEWVTRVASVRPGEIADALEMSLPSILPQQTRFEPGDDLDRAMRLALAMDRLASDWQLDCGSIACRGPFGDGLHGGSISCLATTLLAATGRPFAATGDMVTGIAMWIGRTLSGATLYCELDAIDREKDVFLVANTGEADAAWSPPDGRFEILAASIHSGRQVPGVVLRQELKSGPATMLGVTLDRNRSEKLTLIAMEGETVREGATALNVTHGWFRTDRAPALRAFEAWANAGATHHGALCPGHLAEATQWLGMLRGLPVATITREGILHGTR